MNRTAVGDALGVGQVCHGSQPYPSPPDQASLVLKVPGLLTCGLRSAPPVPGAYLSVPISKHSEGLKSAVFPVPLALKLHDSLIFMLSFLSPFSLLPLSVLLYI